MSTLNAMLDKLANFVAASPHPDQAARDELLRAIVDLRDEGWRDGVDDDIDELQRQVRDAGDGNATLCDIESVKDSLNSLERRIEDIERNTNDD